MGAWEITKKDLRLLARDRRALATLIAFPLIFITIIGFSTGQLLGWKDENQLLKIAVVSEVVHEEVSSDKVGENAEQSKRNNARKLVGELIGTLESRDGLRITRVSHRDEARRMVDDKEVTAALFIGAEFFDRVDRLTLSDLIAVKDGRLADGLKSLDVSLHSRSAASSTASIIEQLVLADIMQTIAPYVASKNELIKRQLVQKKTEAQAAAKTTPAKPLSGKPTVAGSLGGNVVYQQIVPSYTVMFVFFLVNIMARSFIHERDLGTLRRLRLSPVTSTGLLAGKTLPFFIISVSQTALLFLTGRLLFGMSWGTMPLLLLPVIACTSLAATGLGLLVATVVRTDSQVSAYGNMIVITMAGISGCFMPREWLPEIMQQVSLGTPHAWALIAYDQLLSSTHPGVITVWKSCGILVSFAALFFLIGCWQFNRDL